MKTNVEKYREDFENTFTHLDFIKEDGEYLKTITKRDWDYYRAGREKAQAEIDGLEAVSEMFAKDAHERFREIEKRDKLLEQAKPYVNAEARYHYSLKLGERRQWLKDYEDLKNET